MKRACNSAALLVVIACAVCCVSDGVKRARKLARGGKLYEACLVFEAENPKEPDLRAELDILKAGFVDHVLGRQAAAPEHFDLALRYITESDHPKWKIRELLVELYDAAGQAGAWGKMADAAIAMGDFGKAARVYKEHPDVEGARGVLEKLAREYPRDQSICGSHAGFLGERRDFVAAIAEYQRCQQIEGGTIEQSVYFAAQVAALEKYRNLEKGGRR